MLNFNISILRCFRIWFVKKYLICEFNSLLKTYDWWDTWFAVSFVNILLQCSYIFCSWTVLICFMIDLRWCMLESVTTLQTVANSIRSKCSHLGQPETGGLHLICLHPALVPGQRGILLVGIDNSAWRRWKQRCTNCFSLYEGIRLKSICVHIGLWHQLFEKKTVTMKQK